MLHRVVLDTAREVSLDGGSERNLNTANPKKQDITQELIVRGLARITDDNFLIENGISSTWAYQHQRHH